jgi:hypothetical protein
MTMDSVTGINPSYVSAASPDGVLLTNEGLMIYLQQRLTGLDSQINVLFDKQKNLQGIREQLDTIQNAAETAQKRAELLPAGGLTELTPEELQNIETALTKIETLDPALGQAMRTKLTENGQILTGDTLFGASEAEASFHYVEGLGKQLESSAQLEMISLQSLMSARQTAIQLSTNLVSALNESTKAVVANVGR